MRSLVSLEKVARLISVWSLPGPVCLLTVRFISFLFDFFAKIEQKISEARRRRFNLLDFSSSKAREKAEDSTD